MQFTLEVTVLECVFAQHNQGIFVNFITSRSTDNLMWIDLMCGSKIVLHTDHLFSVASAKHKKQGNERKGAACADHHLASSRHYRRCQR
jgi:hypothetical protein